MGARGDERPRVLIADDYASFRQLLRAVLEESGYVVEEAADGHAALAHSQAAESPLVVLLDLHMLGLTGEQVLDALAATTVTATEAAANPNEGEARSRRVRGCILMSALPEVAGQVAARHQVPFLAKPFAPEELLQVVARASRDATQAWGEEHGESRSRCRTSDRPPTAHR